MSLASKVKKTLKQAKKSGGTSRASSMGATKSDVKKAKKQSNNVVKKTKDTVKGKSSPKATSVWSSRSASMGATKSDVKKSQNAGSNVQKKTTSVVSAYKKKASSAVRNAGGTSRAESLGATKNQYTTSQKNGAKTVKKVTEPIKRKQKQAQNFLDDQRDKGTVQTRAEQMGATKNEVKKAQKQGAKTDTKYHKEHPFLANMTDNVTPWGEGREKDKNYSKKDLETIKKSSETTAGQLGALAGQAVQFAVPAGVGSKVATKTLTKATSKAGALANVGKRAGIETAANTPFNAMNAYETAKDEDGNVDTKKFAKDFAVNTALDVGLGAGVDVAGGIITKAEKSKLVRLTAKKNSGKATEDELKEIDKLTNKMKNKSADETTLSGYEAGKETPKPKEKPVVYDKNYMDKELPTVTGGEKKPRSSDREGWQVERQTKREETQALEEAQKNASPEGYDLLNNRDKKQYDYYAEKSKTQKLNKRERNEFKAIKEKMLKRANPEPVTKAEVQEHAELTAKIEGGTATVEEKARKADLEDKIEEAKTSQAEANTVKETVVDEVKPADEEVKNVDEEELAVARKKAKVSNSSVKDMSVEELNTEKANLEKSISFSKNKSKGAITENSKVRQSRVDEINEELKSRGETVDAPKAENKNGGYPIPKDDDFKAFSKVGHSDGLDENVKYLYSKGVDISEDLRIFTENQKIINEASLPESKLNEARTIAGQKADAIYKKAHEVAVNEGVPKEKLPKAPDESIARTKPESEATTDYTKKVGVGDSTGGKIKGEGKFKEDARREWEDSLIGFENVAKANNDTTMLNQINNFRNVQKQVAGWIRTGRVGADRKISGKPLVEIIDRSLMKDGAKKNDFGEYLVAKSKGDLQKIAALEKTYGKDIKSFYSDLSNYLDDISKYRVESGIDESITKILPESLGENIDDLYENIVKATRNAVEEGELNRVIESYAKNIGVDTEAIKNASKEEIEEMSFVPKAENNDYSLTYFSNGKRVTIKADRQTVLGLKEWSGADREAWVQALYNEKLTKAGRVFKGLITDWNVVFGIRNGARDFQQAIVNSKDTKWFSRSLPDSARMLGDESNPMRKLYDSFGGKYSTLFEIDKLSKLDAKDPNVVVKKIEGFNSCIESVPRMSEFAGTIKKVADGKIDGGLSKLWKDLEDKYADALKKSRTSEEYKAAKKKMEHEYYQKIIDSVDGDVISEAMRNSNDITLNFGRSGYKAKALNSGAVPFFNPSIQGLSKTIRLFSEGNASGQLVSILAKLGGFTVAPALANEFFLRGNEAYQKLADREKDNNYFIPIGDSKFIKIPKPRENAVLAEPFEYGLRYALSKAQYGDWDTKESLVQMFKSGVDNIGVANPLTDNLFSPIMDTLMNKTWTGDNIETPYEMQNLASKDRYNERTTYVARWLGNTPVAKYFKMSPKKIDNIMDSYLGLIYDYGIKLTTEENLSKMQKNPANTIASPLIAQFVKDGVFSNKDSGKYWDKYEELQYKSNDKSLTEEERAKAKEEFDAFDSKYGYDVNALNRAINDATMDKSVSADQIRKMRESLNKLYEVANNGEDVKFNVVGAIGRSIGYEKALSNYTMSKTQTNFGAYKETMDFDGMSKKEKEEASKAFYSVYASAKTCRNTIDGDTKDCIDGYTIGIATVRAMTTGKFKSGKGYEDAIISAYGISDNKATACVTYVTTGGNLKTYANTDRAMLDGIDRIQKNNPNVSSSANYNRAMILAEDKSGMIDREYLIKECDYKMNASRCLTQKKYKWTAKETSVLALKIDKDENGYMSKEEIVSEIEKSRAKTTEEKCALFELYGRKGTRNPYGTLKDYSLEGDVGIESDDGKTSSSGRRRGRRGGWGHGGGGGSGSGSSDWYAWLKEQGIGDGTGGTAKSTVKVKDNTSKSGLNDAYRKRVRKLMNS